jgi:hypothetical protein
MFIVHHYNSEKYDTVNVECEMIQWVVYTARVEEIRNVYNILAGDYLGNLVY